MSKSKGSKGRGRLGNQLIRNLVCSIISEKFNLYIEYSWHDIIRKLGINLYVETQKHNTTIIGYLAYYSSVIYPDYSIVSEI